MASIPIHNETAYTLTDDITQQIIGDAHEHFGEEVRAIRVQSGIARHALNARTREVRYAFFPQDFGLGHTMPAVQEHSASVADLPTMDAMKGRTTRRRTSSHWMPRWRIRTRTMRTTSWMTKRRMSSRTMRCNGGMLRGRDLGSTASLYGYRVSSLTRPCAPREQPHTRCLQPSQCLCQATGSLPLGTTDRTSEPTHPL
jgi:hypothetical protein